MEKTISSQQSAEVSIEASYRRSTPTVCVDRNLPFTAPLVCLDFHANLHGDRCFLILTTGTYFETY